MIGSLGTRRNWESKFVMKVLYVDHGNVVHDGYIYRYYGDLFRELSEIAEVYLHQGSIPDINLLADQFQADCIIFGLGYFGQGGSTAFNKVEGLSEIKIPIVCMLNKLQIMLEEKLHFCKINNVNLIVDSHYTYKEFETITGVRSIRLPFTATSKHFYPRDISKIHDIGFCGAWHGGGKITGPTGNLRNRIFDLLQGKSYNIFWNGQDLPSDRINSVEKYSTKINECKVWLATTGPMKGISPRYFEVMMSKTLLFCNKMPESYEDYFVDGVNCVMFENDLSNFEEKLNYYLNNEEERERIVKTAYDTASNNYTTHHMARRLLNEIEELR